MSDLAALVPLLQLASGTAARSLKHSALAYLQDERDERACWYVPNPSRQVRQDAGAQSGVAAPPGQSEEDYATQTALRDRLVAVSRRWDAKWRPFPAHDLLRSLS